MTTAAIYIPRAVVGKEKKVMVTVWDENGSSSHMLVEVSREHSSDGFH